MEKLKNIAKETLFLAAIGFLASMVMPWWIIAPVFVAVVFFLNPPDGRAYADGFLAASIIWGLYATSIDHANLSILSTKIGQVFSGLKASHLLWLTASLGGILGGFAAMTGSSLRKLVWPNT